MFSIIYEPVHGIIYKNSKKEKRVMRHSEIHKFCDATLNKVLEGLKSYNNDVRYGYIQRDLTEDKIEYLKLFKEEIECETLEHVTMTKSVAHNDSPKLGNNTEDLLVKLLGILGLNDKVVNTSSMGHTNALSPIPHATAIAPPIGPSGFHAYDGPCPMYYTPLTQPINGNPAGPSPSFVCAHGLVQYISLVPVQQLAQFSMLACLVI
ncbi:hypothetical protein Tco_0772679 [Tanacetum coccineum]|uniref:Uncharacterized protein n=1 Tax=Tanacetum coccineum TaxID=301880 RepID=A0ABQ4ZIJ7_9ASTR